MSLFKLGSLKFGAINDLIHNIEYIVLKSCALSTIFSLLFTEKY